MVCSLPQPNTLWDSGKVAEPPNSNSLNRLDQPISRKKGLLRLVGNNVSIHHSAEDGGFELPLLSTHLNADYDISPHSSGFECKPSKRNNAEKHLTTSKCTHKCTHGGTYRPLVIGNQNCAQTPSRPFSFLRPWPTWAASSPAQSGQKRKQK